MFELFYASLFVFHFKIATIFKELEGVVVKEPNKH
jgi:hypothetical protein